MRVSEIGKWDETTISSEIKNQKRSRKRKLLLIMMLSWHHIGTANMVNDEKGYLKNQLPSCIIYLESESDASPICPQNNTNFEIASTFGRVGCYFFLSK